MPQRIQRTRRAGSGYVQADGSVYKGQPVYVGRPGKWGNPIHWNEYPTIKYDYEGEAFRVSNAERRRWAAVDFDATVRLGVGYFAGYPSQDEIRRELAGRDLACWCPLPEPGQPDHCHAAVLIELSNRSE